MLIDIHKLLTILSRKRVVFVSEADFQLELGWLIKELYPDSLIRLEYVPSFNPDMHIDILVIINNEWIPIELKYKTKECCISFKSEHFHLKTHGAKDQNCYRYLKDIQRIETVKQFVPSFIEGYTIFISNDQSYTKSPIKQDCIYRDFSLEDGITKTGHMEWAPNTSPGTRKGCDEPIILKGEYPIKWFLYSEIDSAKTNAKNTNRFYYLVNTIR